MKVGKGARRSKASPNEGFVPLGRGSSRVNVAMWKGDTSRETNDRQIQSNVSRMKEKSWREQVHMRNRQELINK